MIAYILLGGAIAAQGVSLRFTEPHSANDPPVKWWPLRDDLASALLDCGRKHDCPRDYSIADVIKAAASQLGNAAVNTNLAHVHEQARAACKQNVQINNHGGWCYADNGQRVDAGPDSDIDYALTDGHYPVDVRFAVAIANNILLKQDGSCCLSITDLGAGVGQLGHTLRAKHPTLQYYGYDGAGNVEEFTHNYVRFGDLTQPMNLQRTDWVISSEVGEHIPHALEKQVIANVHAHNCKGIILTWAALKQIGKGHINVHSNQYLIDIFEELDYTYNKNLTETLRKAASKHHSFWLKNSTMVFERKRAPAGCN